MTKEALLYEENERLRRVLATADKDFAALRVELDQVLESAYRLRDENARLKKSAMESREELRDLALIVREKGGE